MWPWGHLAVGYLVYSLLRRRAGASPSAVGTVALAIGTQFPDLVDKPLAWTVGVLPNGRSLAHSLVIVALLWLLVLAVGRRLDRREPARAFVVGYALHLAGDALRPLLAGDVADLAFLGWPILPPVAADGPRSFAGHFLGMELTPLLAVEFGLVALALACWVRDGTPGVAAIRARLA